MRSKMMSCLVDYDDNVERRLTRPLLMPKYKADTGVANLVKNTMQKAVVNRGVSKTKKVRNNTLHKGSTGLLYQRAGKQLEQQRSVLGMINGYIDKYPTDTNARVVV